MNARRGVDCAVQVDIAGTKVLYTGDYSREEDRHLKAAEIPEVRMGYTMDTHPPDGSHA